MLLNSLFSNMEVRIKLFDGFALHSHSIDGTITIRASTFLDVIGLDRKAEPLDQQSVALITVSIVPFSYITEINIV